MFKRKYRVGKQQDRLLQYLQDKDWVTPLNIINDCWIVHYNEPIRKLRNKWYKIEETEKIKKNRHWDKIRYTRYKLHGNNLDYNY